MRTQVRLAVLAVAVVVGTVVVGAVLVDDDAPAGPTAQPPPQAPGLLAPSGNGDGDSWRDTQGREYRLGLVNAPEHDQCFGAEATAERRAQTADGFRADVYTTDRHGRDVSVVTTADGVNLNLHLARQGFADDRFLSEFRSENEALARDLDAAFAAARREGKGLWSACRSQEAPAPAAAAPAALAAGCHPDYLTCVPVRGDGTGEGGDDDLDCGDVTGAVQLRQPGVDPYRFDADGDGFGCDS